MKITIKQVGITEFQQRTWGRVYINFVVDGIEGYASKEWQFFKERNFAGKGQFQEEPSYAWFNETCIADADKVLDGQYDHLNLTPDKYKTAYGTPSKILAKLITDVEDENIEDVDKRRGWYSN
ncbi:hypothetical protein [Carboxylicivirga sp. N1Y90]|uniref:hypothetical protein n=1 Tax=Carboxylicivirga fragile TaxID=3417571 RepID=UPI003D342C32|nr:hypothetical protein [Marinilabiliaceae bacterium N1Y90]